MTQFQYIFMFQPVNWPFKSCRVRQLTGKPNQKIPVAPFYLIPAVSQSLRAPQAGHSFSPNCNVSVNTLPVSLSFKVHYGKVSVEGSY